MLERKREHCVWSRALRGYDTSSEELSEEENTGM